MDLETTVLGRLTPWRQAMAWHIAFSGGLDSSVLLHLLSRAARTESIPPLDAIHVHHGLQSVADDWIRHCRAVCADWNIPLRVIRVDVARDGSLEQAAREARYAAFRQEVGANEMLLTAHHADDQAETLLFRLLRGSGVKGLSAMPKSRSLGEGLLLRPLLDVPRERLEQYASKHRLAWVEDPSNQDLNLSRNFLRHRVMPLLQQYSPHAVAHMSRACGHLREADGLLGELAEQDLQACRQPHSWPWLTLPNLSMTPLMRLSDARQRNALRHWLQSLTSMPDSRHWQQWQTVRDAAPGAEPQWRLPGGRLLRSQNRLWWLPDTWLAPQALRLDLYAPDRPQSLPNNGWVRLSGDIPAGNWSVGYRSGGESLYLPGRGHRDLKRLLNERNIPVFLRSRLPLLFHDGRLAAVANIDGLDGSRTGQWRFHWTPPKIQAD